MASRSRPEEAEVISLPILRLTRWGWVETKVPSDKNVSFNFFNFFSTIIVTWKKGGGLSYHNYLLSMKIYDFESKDFRGFFQYLLFSYAQ